jgi:hypothetical protein
LSAKREEKHSQDGNLVLTALIIFWALLVMGTAVIKISSMEIKMSSYAFKAEQAQQAADAGVDWVVEKIYRELQNHLADEVLPEVFSFTGPDLHLGSVNIDYITRLNQTSNPEEENYCIYSVKASGFYAGAGKTVKVTVRYNYTGGYTNDESFISRNYLDRGRIITYKIEN